MIVYYNSENGNISGMSAQIDPNRVEPYIETNDPLAMDIFLGKEKLLKYKIITGSAANTGFIQPKTSTNTNTISIKDRIHLIDKDNNAEINIIQNTANKNIVISITELSLCWWEQDSNFKHKGLYLAACVGQDPYAVLWTKAFSQNDFKDRIVSFPYVGRDQLCFYTNKIFKSYNHEIKSS
jgi:hypothetical protein